MAFDVEVTDVAAVIFGAETVVGTESVSDTGLSAMRDSTCDAVG